MSPTATTSPLAVLAPLAARSFASGDELAESVVDLARDLLGLDTALVAHVAGGTWTAIQARSGRFGIRPGDHLPLQDTF